MLPQQGPVDKNKRQQLTLNLGRSCGFQFQLVEDVWMCLGEDCRVQVRLEDGKIMEDGEPHYTRYYSIIVISDILQTQHKCHTYTIKVREAIS